MNQKNKVLTTKELDELLENWDNWDISDNDVENDNSSDEEVIESTEGAADILFDGLVPVVDADTNVLESVLEQNTSSKDCSGQITNTSISSDEGGCPCRNSVHLLAQSSTPSSSHHRTPSPVVRANPVTTPTHFAATSHPPNGNVRPTPADYHQNISKIRWYKRHLVTPPSIILFNQEPLPPHISNLSEPIQFLKLYLTDDFIGQICYQSNLYAQQKN